MAIVGTVRAANITPHARGAMVSTIVPLAPGLVTDSVQPSIRALDALGAGQHAAVQYSRPTRFGVPKHADGSWKLIRVHFPAVFDAATTGRWSYSHYTERDIVLETGPAAVPTFAPHPAVDLSTVRLRFRVAARQTFSSATSAPYRQVEFNPLQGRYHTYAAPHTEVDVDRVEFHDTTGGTNRWVRAYRVHGRIVPERFGASPDDEPSIVGNFLYEIPDGSVPGWGRCVRWWFQWVNNDITMDADARAVNGTACELTAVPQLDIASTDQITNPITVQSFLGTLWKPSDIDIPGGKRIQLYDPSSGSRIANGGGRVIRGCIWFDGGDPLTPLDIETKNSILWQDGEQQWPSAICLDWPNRESFGPYGYCPTPGEFGWSSRDAIRDQVLLSREAGFAYRLGGLQAYKNSSPWPSDPLHTGSAGAGRGGNQNHFGAAFLLDFAMGGHPDDRGVWHGCSMEATRPSNFREANGEHWNFADPSRRSGDVPAPFYSPWVMFEGVPKWSSNWTGGAANGTYNIRIGDKPGATWAEHGGKMREAARSGPGNGVYNGYPSSHFEWNGPIFGALLFGDRWVLDWLLEDGRSVALNTLPTPLEATFSQFGASDVGLLLPRSDGRTLKTRAGIWSVTGDPIIVAECAKRVSRIWEWEKNGSYPSNRNPNEIGGNLEVPLACIVADRGYPREKYYDCATGQIQNALDSRGNPIDNYGDFEGWNGFQQTQFIMGVYGAWRIMTLADPTTYATEIARAAEMIAKITKAIVLHGMRDKGPGNTLQAYYCVDWNRGNNWATRGAALTLADQAVELEWCTDRLLPRDGLYGEMQPNRFNLPKFKQRKPANDWNRWSFPGSALALDFNPGDTAVANRIDELFVTRSPFPSLDGIRGTLDDYSDSWPQWMCIIPNPVTRWTTGSRTFQGSANLTVSMQLTSDGRLTRTGVADPTVSMVLSILDGQVVAFPIEGELTQGSADLTIGMALTADGSVQRQGTANLTIGMDLTASPSRTTSDKLDLTLGFALSVNGTTTRGTIGGGGGDPEPTPDPNTGQTIQQAIGPTQQRARGARITRNGDGTLTRTTFPLPYRSRPPRDDDIRRIGRRTD